MMCADRLPCHDTPHSQRGSTLVYFNILGVAMFLLDVITKKS